MLGKMPTRYSNLVSSKELRAKDNIARLVHTMDIAKGSSNREHWADGTQSLVNLPDLKNCI